MVHAVNFDTLAYANKLKQAGMPDKQAEAQSEALAEIFDYQAATKKDLQEMETKLIASTKKDLQEVETRLTTRIDSKILQVEGKISQVEGKISQVEGKISQLEVKVAEIKSEIIKWVVGLFFAQSALIISFLKFFR